MEGFTKSWRLLRVMLFSTSQNKLWNGCYGGDVVRQVCCEGERMRMGWCHPIGRLDGKEVCRRMQPCRMKFDQGGELKLFVVSGVDETEGVDSIGFKVRKS